MKVGISLYLNKEDASYVMDVNSRRSLITEVNYTHNFGPYTSLSGGVQNTLSHSRNQYITTDYEPVLTENNNYIYLRFGQQIKKVYVSAATGMKLFWMKNDGNHRHFISNLTQASISWQPSSEWSVRANFRYTPLYPVALFTYGLYAADFTISVYQWYCRDEIIASALRYYVYLWYFID